MALVWPPTLAELKIDKGVAADDTRDDEALSRMLAASTAFIKRVHVGRYNFDPDESSELPVPDADMTLGVIRLALRWQQRKRSPDALINMGDLGQGRVPSFDVDIDRMLRIGKFSPAAFA
jgi:hypothetical protein